MFRKHGSKEFHCFFAFPLPPQVIVFQLGSLLNCNERLAINVILENEAEPHRVGYLEKNANSVCLQPKWPEAFLARSHILYEKVAIHPTNIVYHVTIQSVAVRGGTSPILFCHFPLVYEKTFLGHQIFSQLLVTGGAGG